MPGETKPLKILLIGNSAGGKSQILNRFIDDSFPLDQKATIGADLSKKTIEIGDNNSYSLNFWDVGGLENQIKSTFSDNSDAIGIVLDGTQLPDEQQAVMTKWFELVEDQVSKGVPIYFIVNKIDSPDFKKYKEGKYESEITTWNKKKKEGNSSHQDIPVLFCSAKYGDGVEKIFVRMTQDYATKISAKEKSEENTDYPPADIPSEDPSLWEWDLGVNAFLFMATVILMIVAVSPVGGVFALGGLSGVAVVGIIGGGALLLWNVGHAIFNCLCGGEEEPPSTVLDNPSTSTTDSPVASTPSNTRQSTLGYPPGQIFQPGTQQQTTESPASTTNSMNQTSSTTPKPVPGNEGNDRSLT